MKRIAIVQSCYVPWRGFFDMLRRVDEFVLFDDVQYTRRDWRNRNRIKGPHGAIWLTIPVAVRGRFRQSIDETLISDRKWVEKHWATITGCYRAAEYFDAYRDSLEELYLGCEEVFLSKINLRFLRFFCEILGISTTLRFSSEFNPANGRTERLVSICQQAGASQYLSGPRARDYLELDLFEEVGIEVEWMDYQGYAEYRQLYGPFDPRLSIVDLVLNEGPAAASFLIAGGTEEGSSPPARLGRGSWDSKEKGG